MAPNARITGPTENARDQIQPGRTTAEFKLNLKPGQSKSKSNQASLAAEIDYIRKEQKVMFRRLGNLKFDLQWLASPYHQHQLDKIEDYFLRNPPENPGILTQLTELFGPGIGL
jgi:hypothetical protein